MSAQPDSATVAKALQDCVAADLAAGAEFTGVTILSRRKGTIAQDIEAALAEVGACIYVLPGLPLHFLDAQPLVADRYEVRVRAIENPSLNATLPDAYELVELIARRLHGRDYTAIAGMAPLVFAERPIVEQSDPERIIHDVVFQTSLGLLPRVAT
ncbi:MAG: hypothetical protein HZA93_23855 [Verrucomicrobia bacterium]|nr:hypothetical protein [Verrucomicrobiota bacterium]